MAEIKIERRQRSSSILPWVLGLLVVALVILAAASALHRRPLAVHRSGAAAADTSEWDNIPPRLRQYAALTVELPAAPAWAAAA